MDFTPLGPWMPLLADRLEALDLTRLARLVD